MMMKLELAGKTAIVTGASRGIGLATVHALLGEGVRVVGSARRISPELERSGAVSVAVDLAQPVAARQLVDAAVDAYGTVELLVNSVGGGDNLTLAGFLDLTDEDWAATLDLNLMAAVRVTRAALPLLTQRRGVIVNVSSVGAWQPEQPPLAYNVAKAALKTLSRGLANEFAHHGVRVVTVTPGPTRTAMWEQYATLAGVPVEDVLAAVPEQIGMITGRLAEPTEVANLITYLLSPRAASITGSDHRIDGGAIRTA